MQETTVQRQLLIPSALTLLVLFSLFATLLLLSQKRSVDETTKHTMEMFREDAKASFAAQARAMIALQDMVANTTGAKDALAAQDRVEIQHILSSTYEHLRDHFGVTQFYIHGPDQVNILRLHDPERYGDTIVRNTVLLAETSQQPSSGFELGIGGTFTLSTVSPVYKDAVLIGYIELGKEVKDVVSSIAASYDLDWAIFINKSDLNESDWAQGLSARGRMPNWNQFDAQVLSISSYSQIPFEWSDEIESVVTGSSQPHPLDDNVKVAVIPLMDTDVNRAGTFLVFLDESARLETYLKQDYFLLTALALLMIVLLYVIRWALAKADRRVDENQQLLHFQSTHDVLTGLPNRKFLYDRLTHALDLSERCHMQLAVLVIDLDNFKDINDCYGHDAGDELLCRVSDRLLQLIRRDDTLVRNSGDEFIVLLEDVTSENDCAALAHKLITVLSVPFQLSVCPVNISVSIGISLFPRDGKSIDGLLVNADSAMHHAKTAGKNRYDFYNLELAAATQRRLHLEKSLRLALKQQAMTLAFQPQVNLFTGKVSGVEALLRWNDPHLGVVSPEEFIPIAEESGLINSLGAWVLFSACSKAKHWLDERYNFGKIAVNVSAKQLQNAEFVTTIQEALKITGLPAHYLEIEITETVVMSNLESSIFQLNTLRKMGVSISIDDFGTGYSSLFQLKALPIQTLKIDRSFIHGLPGDDSDAVISRTIIAMASNLGLNIIAEGVETPEQARFLKQNGCANIQGYLFSRPVTALRVEEMLQAQAPKLQPLTEFV